MTNEQFNESVNADIRRMLNKAQTQLTWPSISEQQAYWQERDEHLDRIESATQWFDSKQGERVFDGEDAEEWMRRSDIDLQGEERPF